MRHILSIDGGGIMGMVPARVLIEIEARTGKPCCELFDLIAGTSTGGILALGLSVPDEKNQAKYSAKDLIKLYEDEGDKIFHRSFWRKLYTLDGIAAARYSAKGIETLLEKYFLHAGLGSALTNVVCPSYDIQNRSPYFFKSWRKNQSAVEMRLAARATSAAPIFFPPTLLNIDSTAHALVDGGVYINNPAMSAYVEAKKLFPEEERFNLVSLGSGESLEPISYDEAKGWGIAGWAAPLLASTYDGVSDAVDYQLKELLTDNYYRLDPSVTIASPMLDDVSSENIANLLTEGDNLVKANDKVIDRICQQLLN